MAKLCWLTIAVALLTLLCSEAASGNQVKEPSTSPPKGFAGKMRKGFGNRGKGKGLNKPTAGGPLDWNKRQAGKRAGKAKARGKAGGKRPASGGPFKQHQFFDATAMGKQVVDAEKSKKIGLQAAKGLAKIAELGAAQQAAWAKVVYKGQGKPVIDTTFRKTMKEVVKMDQDLLAIAAKYDIPKELMIRKNINIPQRMKPTDKHSAARAKATKFPIRDQAHLDTVVASFKYRATALEPEQAKALTTDLNAYVAAESRILEYKKVVQEVRMEEKHYMKVNEEFGERHGNRLREIEMKAEGEEGTKRREQRQRKYDRAQEHKTDLFIEARSLRTKLEQRVSHMEL